MMKNTNQTLLPFENIPKEFEFPACNVEQYGFEKGLKDIHMQ